MFLKYLLKFKSVYPLEKGFLNYINWYKSKKGIIAKLNKS